MSESLLKFYSSGEELANVITHALGIVLVIAGLATAFSLTPPQSGEALAAQIIYGASLLGMYLASTLYHAVRDERRKLFCRRLDHCAIYLLIAGTYTPLMMLAVRGASGGAVLAFVWVLAAVGIGVKCFTMRNLRHLSLVLYLLMGWCCLVVLKQMILGMGAWPLTLLIAGGVAYTAGVVFYVMKRPYCHAVWHLFVLAGSSLHFLAVFTM